MQDHALPPPEEAGGASVDTLSPEAAEIFAKLAQIPGNARSHMAAAQIEVNKLEGQPASKALADALNHFLREKKWGVRCVCGRVATVVFTVQRTTNHTKAGVRVYKTRMIRFCDLRLNDQGPSVHGGRTRLPQLELMPRPLEAERWKSLWSVPMSREVASVMAALFMIGGNDQAAMEQAQTLLTQLTGLPGTEQVTCALKILLRRKRWGVRCSCGKSATFGWSAAGRMFLWHFSEQKKVIRHQMPTEMPHFELVSRPRRTGSGRKRHNPS